MKQLLAALCAVCWCLAWSTAALAEKSAVDAASPKEAATSTSATNIRLTTTDILCPTVNDEARQDYNSALAAKLKGDLKEAERLYRLAVARDERYCDAMDNLGQLLRMRGRMDEAISWYERSLAVKPDNAVAHQNLAVVYDLQGEAEKAQAQYQWIIRHDPTNPEGYYGAGLSLLNAGSTDTAIVNLALAEKYYREQKSPLVEDARYLLGVAHFRKNDYAKARDYLLPLYEQKRDDPNLNYLLGLCYLDPAKGDRKRARELILKARDLGQTIDPAILLKIEKPD
ncbi:MAG TPA: tetratricopeptide repeat protein [Geobacteraceae bacterium]